MTLEYYRLLFDFGLFVLIWLVQLVVYPGFKYYQREQLLKWHPLYTFQITFVALPLMFGQLILSVIQLWERLDWYTGISFVVIVLLWGLTFLQFVPLHNNISNSNFDNNITTQLVRKNWLRTILWTGLFFLSLMNLSIGF